VFILNSNKLFKSLFKDWIGIWSAIIEFEIFHVIFRKTIIYINEYIAKIDWYEFNLKICSNIRGSVNILSLRNINIKFLMELVKEFSILFYFIS